MRDPIFLPNDIPQLTCPALGDRNDEGASERARVFAGHILRSMVPREARIITLDGVSGVGKTFLGGELASALGLPALDLDDYIQEKKNCFLPVLDRQRLSADIEAALASNGKVVISGVLVAKVLALIGRAGEFQIYLLKTAGLYSNPEVGDLIDEFELLCGGETIDEAVAREEAEWRRDGSALPGVRREIVEYHVLEQPHRNANLIVRMQRLT